ncbi:MAG TPA: glycosyltransferase [Candidatus Paceibacterota bacterium]|nr:glycosyltransferase [Candidatus Paceibacterota bacterium]HMP19141.1 glycosyltransferase [Candidatus Paceibacterota bacterium]HMP85150.1 glycosyltransferase [Candidatus Paceibacterota bacterium]
MNKFFSIITPTHNRSFFLKKNIESIQKQKLVGVDFDYEHIIVDNNSTDDTEKIVQEIAKLDPRIIYIKNDRNIGPADALNIGFKKSVGKYIIPADDDDLFPMSSLKFRYDFMSQNSQIDWSYGYSIFIDENDCLWKDLLEYNIKFYDLDHNDSDLVFEKLFERCFISGGTVTIKRECIEKVGGWDISRKTQDFDMWLRLANENFRLARINSYLYYYRVHPNMSSKIHKKENIYSEEQRFYLEKYKNRIKNK